MDDLPAALKRLRAASGLTQVRVRERGGPTPESLSEIEHGKTVANLATLETLLSIYGYRLIIVPVADESELTALDKPVLLLLAQAGHDLAVAVDAMGDASTDLSVRMRQVERAVKRYWELLEALGIKERDHE